VLGNLFIMDRKHDVLIHPNRNGHLASSRKALRRFFMIARAAFI
jgi:hypothetical protein